MISKKLQERHEILSFRSLFIFICLFSIILYGGLYQRNIVLIILSYGLLFLNLILAFKIITEKDKDSQKKIYIYMFFISILVRLFMVWSSPVPYIDVYDYLTKGAQFLLQNLNPYSMTYTKLYPNFTPDYYGYPPGMLYLSLPFVAILKDPRYLFVLSELLVALLILNLIKGKKEQYIYSLSFLNNPISVYMVEQSYTEPLILFLIFFSVWLLIKKRHFLFTFLLGLLLSTKQYLFLLLPLYWHFLREIKSKFVLLIGGIILALLLTAPFLVWDYGEFMKDVVFLQGQFSPRYEGLSFFSLVFRMGGSYNFLISLFIIIPLFLYIYLQDRVDPARFFCLSPFLFLVFFFFNKWSFINYYYLVSQLLLIGSILDSEK